MAAGEYELALKAYYRAASVQGVNSDVLSAIGSADLKLGRLNQAEKILRRALEEEPSFVPAVNNLGVVLMEEGKYGEARAVFQQAFALDSGKSVRICAWLSPEARRRCMVILSSKPRFRRSIWCAVERGITSFYPSSS